MFSGSLYGPLKGDFFFKVLRIVYLLLPGALVFDFSIHLGVLSGVSLTFFFSMAPKGCSLCPVIIWGRTFFT